MTKLSKTTFTGCYWIMKQHSHHILATSRQGFSWKCKALFPQSKAIIREIHLWRLEVCLFEAALSLLYLIQARVSSLFIYSFFVIMTVDAYLRVDRLFSSFYSWYKLAFRFFLFFFFRDNDYRCLSEGW